ncbi:hypothetical protein [Falsirhodobacter sp. 20TX0035]|uniref:hypothetical protein n=1 Tax=Falsirhodobacter sp. 20TX0035 TaxID=3022019 RepID=UPI0023301E8C|nr:hypothetical protein [Falsirhodobacter sp. 20TX0035]MDB6454743.1 hypothetical protein [Falsirhodobacter sp. 20TX0035]
MQRFDLISPRPRKDGKTNWVKIGAAFPRDKGGFSLVFDALPLPDAEGRVTVLMTEPKPREDDRGQQEPRGGNGYGAGGRPSGRSNDFDDEIPFQCEWRV